MSGISTAECRALGSGTAGYGQLEVAAGTLVFAGKARLALSSIRTVTAATGIVTISHGDDGIWQLCFERVADATRAARAIQAAAKAAVGVPAKGDGAVLLEDEQCLVAFGHESSRGRFVLTAEGMSFKGSFGLDVSCSAISKVTLVDTTVSVTFRVPVKGAPRMPGMQIIPRKAARRWATVLKAAAAAAADQAIQAKASFRAKG